MARSQRARRSPTTRRGHDQLTRSLVWFLALDLHRRAVWNLAGMERRAYPAAGSTQGWRHSDNREPRDAPPSPSADRFRSGPLYFAADYGRLVDHQPVSFA